MKKNELDPIADVEETFSEEYESIGKEVIVVLSESMEKCRSFDEFLAELEKLRESWKPDSIAKNMAVASFSARAKGNSYFEG